MWYELFIEERVQRKLVREIYFFKLKIFISLKDRVQKVKKKKYDNPLKTDKIKIK
jgi:hypothetical protein